MSSLLMNHGSQFGQGRVCHGVCSNAFTAPKNCNQDEVCKELYQVYSRFLEFLECCCKKTSEMVFCKFSHPMQVQL